MVKPYSLLSDEEPTDEQLAWLMHEVGEEARRRGEETKRQLREEIHRQSLEAQQRWAKMTARKDADA